MEIMDWSHHGEHMIRVLGKTPDRIILSGSVIAKSSLQL